MDLAGETPLNILFVWVFPVYKTGMDYWTKYKMNPEQTANAATQKKQKKKCQVTENKWAILNIYVKLD